MRSGCDGILEEKLEKQGYFFNFMQFITKYLLILIVFFWLGCMMPLTEDCKKYMVVSHL